MRLGVIWLHVAAAHYRAIQPMQAMERRGHQVVWPPDADGTADPTRLAGCDVVHSFRRCDDPTRQLFTELARAGTAITYDNEDDLAAIPKESPNYKELGGLEGRRSFARSLKAAHIAKVCTTTNEVLAQKYRRGGVERVEVIGNYLAPDFSARRTRQDDAVVIGWVAGGEHRTDAKRLRIARVLRRLVDDHESVRVMCIGLDLGLGLPERYRHHPGMHLSQLPSHIANFDIGIAPLADIPFNRARSDIKLKEYAASGVPWLASQVAPYAGLGEEQGGQLVSDDGWLEALEQLVTHPDERQELGRKAKAWAKGQTIEAAADRWEQVFAEAAGVPVADARPRAARRSFVARLPAIRSGRSRGRSG